MGAGAKQVVGYKYYMGIHCILCRGPIDEIKSIRFADIVAWQGSITTSQEITIDEPDLFGGEDKEGGVAGKVDVMMGESTQTRNPYLQEKITKVIPSFRSLVGLVFKSFYFSAMTPYAKQPSIEGKRIPSKTWLPLLADINGAANPAHAILEMLTHPEWGMGYQQSDCNMVQLAAVAQTLYDEGFGLSFILNSEDDYEKTIQMIMTHINGLFFVEPRTGLYTIKLLRGDYLADVASLPLIDEYNGEVESFSRPNYSELVNEIIVKYRPQSTTKDDTITVQNLAAIQSQGAVVSQSVNYPAIDNATLAAFVASRDLRQKSTPLAHLKIKVNREQWSLTIGDVFRFSWSVYGIDQLVFRVIQMNYGSIEDGKITVEAIEDIFGLSVATYITNQPSEWVNPSQPPQNLTNYKVGEATYYDIIQSLGEVDGANIVVDVPGVGYLKACAAQPEYTSPSFELWTPTGVGDNSTTQVVEYPPFDPILSGSISGSATTIPIQPCDSSKFYYVETADEFTINGETFFFVSMTDSAIVVATRTGSSHAAGSKVLFQPNPSAANPPAIKIAINAVDTTIAASGFDYATDMGYIDVNEYYLMDSEIVKVTAGSLPGTITISRGQKGTAPAAHIAKTFFRRLFIPTRLTNIYERKGSSDYAPAVKVTANIGIEVTTVLSSFISLGGMDRVTVGFYGEWDDEIVKVEYVDTNIAILHRGCLDTVPQAHLANSVIYFSQQYQAFSDYQYLEGDSVKSKLRTRTPGKLLALSSATEHTTTMANRAGKPYAPGNVQVNGEVYPVVISGPINLTWSHRSRLLQTAEIVEQTEGGIGPEVGTEYRVELVGEGSLTTTATDFSWCAETSTVVTVKLGSTCNTLDSYQDHQFTFERSGWGYNWGNYWGGSGPDGTALVTCAPAWLRSFQRVASSQIAARYYNNDGSYLQITGTNETQGPGSDFWFTARLYTSLGVEVTSATAGHRLAGNILYDSVENASYLCFNRLGIDTVGNDQLTRISVTDCSQIITSGTDLIDVGEPGDIGPMAIVNSELWIFAGGKLKRYSLTDLTIIAAHTGLSVPIYATGNGSILYTLDTNTVTAYNTSFATVWTQTTDTACDGLIYAEGWLWTLTGLPGVSTNWGLARIDPATGLMDSYFLSLTELSGGVYDPPFDLNLPFLALLEGLIVIAGAADSTAFVINPVTGTAI